mgnify:CR=1 FL=1
MFRHRVSVPLYGSLDKEGGGNVGFIYGICDLMRIMYRKVDITTVASGM